MLVFQSRISNQLFVVNARNSLAMSSDSESELFITQSSFCGDTAIELDEEERMLIVSFLPKSLSRVLWTSAAGIDRDARRFQRLGAILDWLTGTCSLDLMC